MHGRILMKMLTITRTKSTVTLITLSRS